MASQDPPINAIQAPLQMLGVYDTTKECFLGVAKMLKKGFSPPVFTDDRSVVIASMPSGLVYKGVSIIIYNSLQHLCKRLSQQSEWKIVKTMSTDMKDFFVLVYRSDTFSSQQEAIHHALAKRLEMRQLEYTEAEFEDATKNIKDTIKKHFLGLAKQYQSPNNPAIATDNSTFVGSPSIGGSITDFYNSLLAEMAKNGHSNWIVATFPPRQGISFTIAYCADNFTSKEEAFKYIEHNNETEGLTYTDDELKEGG
jgi:hypothetical protein